MTHPIIVSKYGRSKRSQPILFTMPFGSSSVKPGQVVAWNSQTMTWEPVFIK